MSKVLDVEGPEPCVPAHRTSCDCDVQFPTPRRRYLAIQLRRPGGLDGTKGDTQPGWKEGLLVGELGREARPSQPLVEHQRRDLNSLAAPQDSPKRGARPPRPGEAIDEDRGVEENQRSPGRARRPPPRRAARTSRISCSTSATPRVGARASTTSRAASIRRCSGSPRRPVRAAYSRIASRTTRLLDVPSRAAVRSILRAVSSSRVKVILVAILPYYHIAIIRQARLVPYPFGRNTSGAAGIAQSTSCRWIPGRHRKVTVRTPDPTAWTAARPS